MTIQKVPLNGTRTHPLTPHAVEALESVARQPQPRQEFNPGVANRLLREDLVLVVERPSPFKTHKGRSIEFLQITPAGEAVLAALVVPVADPPAP